MYGSISLEWLKGTRLGYGARKHPWVSRLLGLDERGCFERDFLQGISDYSEARGNTAYRGVRVFYQLPPGVYECYEEYWKRRTRRFFIEVSDSGDVSEINRERVLECTTVAFSLSRMPTPVGYSTKRARATPVRRPPSLLSGWHAALPSATTPGELVFT